MTCWRRACRTRRCCTSNGATTFSSRPSSTSTWRPRTMRRSRSPARSRPLARCMAPMEGRGTVAVWHKRMDQLVLYTGNQKPHIVRNGLVRMSGAEADQGPDRLARCGRRLRLQGHRASGRRLSRLARDALRLSRALDRGSARASDGRRQLPGASLPHHRLRGSRRNAARCGMRSDGRFGAYSSYPFSACLEAAQVASILPGPYDFPSYRCRTWSVATNKCPILPYRGVARTGVCYAIEIMMDLDRARGGAGAV